MAETITITMPEVPQEREEVLQFLAAKGLVPPTAPAKKKGCYAELARQYREEKVLTGYGEAVANLRKEFRETSACSYGQIPLGY